MTPQETAIYTRFAGIYDDAYHFVDYAGGAAFVRDVIRARRPEAGSLLEIACGTGCYLKELAANFEVEGLDLSPEMLAQARMRVPRVPLHHGDMVDFRLRRQFDVVCCLFRAIAYVGTADRLSRAIASMARHLSPGGLLLIEPFFTPETYWVNRVTLNQHRGDDSALAWMYVSEKTSTGARLRIHCLVGTPAGVEHFVEDHDLGLFTPDDFERAFADAGLRLTFEPTSPGGTGLYIGEPR